MTERAIRLACEMVARATARRDGVLELDGDVLTSDRVRSEVDIFLLRNAFANDHTIVAGGEQGGDCHERGEGPLRTGEPVIIDIFPRSKTSRYCGDCTRTVVHGEIPGEIARMHAAVLKAKRAAIASARGGVTGEFVHRATIASIEGAAYAMGLHAAPGDTSIRMVHGTGHGIGLDVHEPPLLDIGGPMLLVGDVLTIEPGLYGRTIGGVRVEDMVAVTATGCENFNSLPEGLEWK